MNCSCIFAACQQRCVSVFVAKFWLWAMGEQQLVTDKDRVTRVTRMAYSPRLWLMAIDW